MSTKALETKKSFLMLCHLLSMRCCCFYRLFQRLLCFGCHGTVISHQLMSEAPRPTAADTDQGARDKKKKNKFALLGAFVKVFTPSMQQQEQVQP